MEKQILQVLNLTMREEQCQALPETMKSKDLGQLTETADFDFTQQALGGALEMLQTAKQKAFGNNDAVEEEEDIDSPIYRHT